MKEMGPLLKQFYIYLVLGVLHICCSMLVAEITGQLEEISSLLLLSWSQKSNSGHQTHMQFYLLNQPPTPQLCATVEFGEEP